MDIHYCNRSYRSWIHISCKTLSTNFQINVERNKVHGIKLLLFFIQGGLKAVIWTGMVLPCFCSYLKA